MKAILAALLVTAVGAAHADTYQFTPPEGWQRHEELGAGIGRRALAESHFGGTHFKAAAVAWVRPGTGAL
ncbi:MAG: hypothetical protein KJO07_24335 [Deltaproteobacteria bacterium]|nr:hypothetical protein [Deltaproteobacteria bacterium]